MSIAQRNRQIQARDAVATSYRFHEIRVLDKLKDSEKAREILERLANDRGILAVMEKHKCGSAEVYIGKRRLSHN